VADKKKYLYGPVPSRRLGRSYGIDIIPFKVCTLDCIYCQLGKTTNLAIERRDYGPVEPIVTELKNALAEGPEVDYITIAGSGEPTLNLRLGELIDRLKAITNTAIAVLTNGTLFYRPDVRADCSKADVVMPSLDAGDEQTFRRINRPHRDISIENVISGLCAFRDEFNGKIWLEVLFVEGVNTGAEQIAKIKEAIERIRPDKVHINTAVRPAAEAGVKKLDAEKLQDLAGLLGPKAEIVADFSPARYRAGTTGCGTMVGKFDFNKKLEDVLSMLKRRPCSLDDICSGLGLQRNEILKYISELQNMGVIHTESKDGKVFFKYCPK
jgi:wyosine [tRNA(Phe)-imidazoG37] synthetase (radical SAM superfamily)/biotin operon repressor